MQEESIHEAIFKPEEKPFRPPVILVFAILTFIGSGYELLTSNVYFGMTDFLPMILPLSIIFFLVLKIVSAAKMLKMKKSGFYLYTAGELGYYIPSIILLKYQEQILQYFYDWAEKMNAPQDSLDQFSQAIVEGSEFEIIIWTFTISATIAWIAVYASKFHKMK